MVATVGMKTYIERYIFKVVEEEAENYVHRKSLILRHGVVVRNRGDVYWVLCYPFTIVICVIVWTWIALHHGFNYSTVSWVSKFFDYNVPIGGSLFAYAIYSKADKIERASRVLDKWWKYSYLEKELEELKANGENVVEKFSYVYSNFMKLGALSYCLLPIWRYYNSADKDPTNLLLFRCWSPFPLSTFWGLSLTFLPQLVTILCAFLMFGSIITYLLASVMTICNQCKLIGLALETIDDRVSRTLTEEEIPEGYRWAKLRDITIYRELRNTVIHLQTVYNVSKEVCEFFTGPVNVIYYQGIACLVICCGKVATERENKFLIVQAILMPFAILLNQYIVARINQLLTDQIENLRFAIYDSAWYTMATLCGRMVNIMQAMVLKKLNIRTMFGSSADLEFFLTVCNASYYYLGALLSMNIKF